MRAVLVDSDILIEVARARDQSVLARWDELSRSDAAILCSPVTIAELWHGVRPQEQETSAELWGWSTFRFKCLGRPLSLPGSAPHYSSEAASGAVILVLLGGGFSLPHHPGFCGAPDSSRAKSATSRRENKWKNPCLGIKPASPRESMEMAFRLYTTRGYF